MWKSYAIFELDSFSWQHREENFYRDSDQFQDEISDADAEEQIFECERFLLVRENRRKKQANESFLLVEDETDDGDDNHDIDELTDQIEELPLSLFRDLLLQREIRVRKNNKQRENVENPVEVIVTAFSEEDADVGEVPRDGVDKHASFGDLRKRIASVVRRIGLGLCTIGSTTVGRV